MRRTSAIWMAVAMAVALPPARAAAAVPARADRDHDKVFDDLEARLGASGRLPVVVSLRAPAAEARVDALARAVGPLPDVQRLHIVDAFSTEATAAQIRALAARPDVAHVEADAPAVPFGVSAQAGFGVTQARADSPGLDGDADGNPAAYSRGDLVAAVIDSGIDPTMPDLGGGKVIGFEDLVNHRTAPYDDLGHGSTVSAVLAGSGASGAEGRGVAPGAALVGVKVINSSAQSTLGLIAQGIQWVVDHRAEYGIRVINLSIGAPDAACPDGTDVASEAVNAAVAAGLVVVAASGNFGPDPCTVKAPGVAASALTVGAMSDPGAGGFGLAWFSSRGPTLDGRLKPDVTAPGVNVVAPKQGGGFGPMMGTSFAAPFAAGAALLLLDAAPALTPAQVKDAIVASAVDWGPPGPDPDSGAGRMDLYRALRRVGAPLATPPAVPGHLVWQATAAAGQDALHDIDVADAGAPLALTMNVATAGPQLSLLDAAGAVVATAVPDAAWLPWPARQEGLTLTAPAPGRYTVRVAGTGAFTVDISGDLAPLDTVAPALTLAPASDAGDPSPAFGGDAGAAAHDFPGVVVHIRQAGVEVRRLAAVPLLGRWSAQVSPPLPDGAYTAEAEQGDDAGNVTRTPALAFSVGTPPPPPPPPPPAATATPVPTRLAAPLPPPPAATLTLAVSRQRLAAALKRGLAVRVACSPPGRVELRLTRGKRLVAARALACHGAAQTVLKLDRRALARVRRAALTLTAKAGARVVTRRVTLS